MNTLTPEYFQLLRSQITDGKLKEQHLSIGMLKERISILEQEQIQLRSTNTRAQSIIKDLEDGKPHLSIWDGTDREELQKMRDSQETGSQVTPRKRKKGAKSNGGMSLPTPEIRRTFGSLGDVNCPSSVVEH